MGRGLKGRGLGRPEWLGRVDEAARRTLLTARDEAVRLGRLNVPEPEHLLVALVRSGGLPVSRLGDLGIDVRDLRRRVEGLLRERGSGRDLGAVEPLELGGVYPLHPRMAEAIEAAVASAEAMGRERASPLDLLVGAVSTQHGVPLAGLLAEVGLDPERSSRLYGSPLLMEIDDDSSTPIFAQIVEQVEERVATGALPPGARLPAVRRLAERLGLAPGTVARAYRELEGRGVLVTAGPLGTRVADRPGAVGALPGAGVDDLAERMRPVVVGAFHAGATAAQLREALTRAMEGIFEDG